MKFLRFVPAFLLLTLTACTTLQNRRDLYFPQQVDGPYTRMLKDGSWRKKQGQPHSVTDIPGEDSGGRDSKSVVPPVSG